MRQVIFFLSQRVSGLHQAAYVLGGFAILSSLLAFVRDRLLAFTFGAGIELDVYYAAFRIPDIIFVTVASLVSVYVLIPSLSAKDEEGQRNYIDTIFVGFSAIITVVSIAAYFFTPYILEKVFPTLVEKGFLDELIVIARILLIQPILLGFSNIFAAIVQVKSRYILYATTPLVYNIGIIIGVIVLYPLFGLVGLAWGVVLGAVLHAGIQLPSLVREGFIRRFPVMYDFSTLKETMSVSFPRAVTLAMSQANIFFLISMAGGLATGSIAIFTLSFNLQSVPLAIIGASYSVAAFPTLARMLSNGQRGQFVEQVVVASRHIIFWSLPAIALAIVLRAYVVRAILGAGAFDWVDTRLTAASFALFVVSLTAHALMLLIIRGYYAAGRTLIPFLVSFFVLVFSVSLGYLFLGAFGIEQVKLFVESLMRVEDVPGSDVLMLPFAYSIASVAGAILLLLLFEWQFGGFFRRVARTFGECLAVAGVTGLVTYTVLSILGGITEATTLLTVFGHGFTAGISGIVVAVILFWLSGNREFNEITKTVREKYKAKTVLSGETEL